MANDDDGFGMDNETVEEKRRNIKPVLDRWKRMRMKKKNKSVKSRLEDNEGAFFINEEVGHHEINEDYDTNELSSNLDNGEDVRENKRHFPKYIAEDMTKGFKFRLGMKFKSLKDFKSALQEHSVLNGKEVKFVNNDLKRVRAICKKGCGFVIMPSKVGSSQTIRVKTLVRHKCGRGFGSKSASVEWIAQAGRAKKIAMDSLVGDGERQYVRLYDYVAELLRVKAGTFKILVNQPEPTLPPRFGSFYMCLDGCKEGFLGSCKSFIGVDGCHLKTSFGETWRWFLTKLLDDIGGIDCQRWIFISDQRKGLMSVFYDILNGVEHRLFLRHLYHNYKKKFGGGLLIRDLMMGTAKATYYKEWEKNGFASLREKVDTYPGNVMPKPRKRLDKEIEKSGNWLPVWAARSQFEVTRGFTMDKFVVDLSNHTCSCYFRDLVGIPCKHVVAAIHYKLENPEHYVHPYYKKDVYRTCYAPIITPINGQQLWPTSDSAPLLPHIYKTPPGRPKKLRRREVDEYVSHSKLSKKNIGMKCSSCNAYGHNVRSCKNG
ncbi:uncharacterized protein LOC106778429 [Vigna radiata var. radiata]|uniref:Uncharacterized protein LOC106778429 n=1 Tax=Vigna radiata var. radiata TaxID=3916 RepID=A0A1S3VU12_VIGRR|nr:uncharacterized protein LOC106778429 [Vigna radiata var. radiata]